jgi:hypothetical protein
MPSEHTLLSADPCTQSSAPSPSRVIFFIVVFFAFILGGVLVFFLASDSAYGVQAASAVSYTTGAVLYTFSANRGMQRYLFDCPFVRPQLRRLAWRHAYFLIALTTFQTILLQLRPHLPPTWIAVPERSRDAPPFVIVLFVFAVILLLAEIMSNRSLLDRAHKEK